MKKIIILTSANPDEYPDLGVECKVIKNCELSDYIKNIPDERKFTAYKSGKVKARVGTEGETVKTQVRTFIDGKEYILHEEQGSVKIRTYSKKILVAGNIDEIVITHPDYVITNISSTSNEEYICKDEQFQKTYILNTDGYYYPTYDPREFAQVDENIYFETSWGEYVTCLAGSYIVTYNALANDYNAVEKGAFEKTYTKEQGIQKKLKRN